MKTLKQIQEENRKIIGKPLTLNRVLISVRDKKINIFPEIYKKYLIVGAWGRSASDSSSRTFYWDLTKETLEEQSEVAQRAINKLLVWTI